MSKSNVSFETFPHFSCLALLNHVVVGPCVLFPFDCTFLLDVIIFARFCIPPVHMYSPVQVKRTDRLERLFSHAF